MICLHTKFHIPSSSGALVLTIKLKAKDQFHAATKVALQPTKKLS
jgi:hypothetical protein